MPERDNDRLESFFKKVSGRPDISFDENDWKKLEAKLDARDRRSAIARSNRNRLAGTTVIAVLLLGGLYWLSQDNPGSGTAAIEKSDLAIVESKPSDDTRVQPVLKPGESEGKSEPSDATYAIDKELSFKKKDDTANSNAADVAIQEDRNVVIRNAASEPQQLVEGAVADKPQEITNNHESKISVLDAVTTGSITLTDDNEAQTITNDTNFSPATADKTKQKANNADSVVREKNDVKVKDAYGSGLTEHPASPRLSLLLSIAPDFSSVSFDYYTDPGQAVGLTLHYHVKRSWSFSTGAVISRKKYIGDGEDYTPPSGYWKTSTNGIIPETIDGSCNVLEIPIMVQYTIANKGKNRFLVGAGVSSYIMLHESYKYNFEQPNPGAKSGWSSKESTSQLLNVINVTAGFEHRVLPGFMVGIEPYLRIPLEGIGWSDLKLYSAGASLTLRYIILNQKNSSAVIPGRGPG